MAFPVSCWITTSIPLLANTGILGAPSKQAAMERPVSTSALGEFGVTFRAAINAAVVTLGVISPGTTSMPFAPSLAWEPNSRSARTN
ncbi:hypothetical protein D3C81_1938470 [compost metagenome]